MPSHGIEARNDIVHSSVQYLKYFMHQHSITVASKLCPLSIHYSVTFDLRENSDAQ